MKHGFLWLTDHTGLCIKVGRYRYLPTFIHIMNRKNRKNQEILKTIKKRGIFRIRDLKTTGIHPEYVRRLLKKGVIRREGKGVYALETMEPTEHHSLAEIAKRVPHGVVCLISALRFHDFTTQLPHQIWVAIDVKAKAPKVKDIAARIVRFSGEALKQGIEEHNIEGVKVKIYSPAKTVADCFKYRNKIGLDVALEALRECIRKRLATRDDIFRFAKICRVANIILPYLESLS